VIRSSSQPWHDLLEAGAIEDGATLVLRYGKKGQPKKTFKGVARTDGIEVDGKVMSPSGAALHCIQSTGSDRRTVNGWTCWKTKSGTLISDLYRSTFESGPGASGSE